MSLVRDVEVLKKTPIVEVRETIADKVSKYFDDSVFDQSEARVAVEIIRLLTKDAEVRVRKTLADNLKNNTDIPHDIILSLAQDVPTVSTLVLEFSKILTDGDLIEIVRSSKDAEKLKAVANRNNLSESVSTAIIRTYNKEVVITLLANDTARISGEGMNVIINEFNGNKDVLSSLVDRGGLSVELVQKLMDYVSGKLKDRLEFEYKIATATASDLAEGSKEQAVNQLLNEKQQPKSYAFQSEASSEVGGVNYDITPERSEKLVRRLYQEGRLTQSIVIRALCEGNIAFFESSISVMSGVPLMNTRALVHDKNPTALQALCRRAGLPQSILKATSILISYIKYEDSNGKLFLPGFKERLLEHIFANGYEKSIPLMPYIIAIVGSKMQLSDVVDSSFDI